MNSLAYQFNNHLYTPDMCRTLCLTLEKHRRIKCGLCSQGTKWNDRGRFLVKMTGSWGNEQKRRGYLRCKKRTSGGALSPSASHVKTDGGQDGFIKGGAPLTFKGEMCWQICTHSFRIIYKHLCQEEEQWTKPSILQDPPGEESATARWERGKQRMRIKEEDTHNSNLETTSGNSETRSLKTKCKGSSRRASRSTENFLTASQKYSLSTFAILAPEHDFKELNTFWTEVSFVSLYDGILQSPLSFPCSHYYFGGIVYSSCPFFKYVVHVEFFQMCLMFT